MLKQRHHFASSVQRYAVVWEHTWCPRWDSHAHICNRDTYKPTLASVHSCYFYRTQVFFSSTNVIMIKTNSTDVEINITANEAKRKCNREFNESRWNLVYDKTRSNLYRQWLLKASTQKKIFNTESCSPSVETRGQQSSIYSCNSFL